MEWCFVGAVENNDGVALVGGARKGGGMGVIVTVLAGGGEERKTFGKFDSWGSILCASCKPVDMSFEGNVHVVLRGNFDVQTAASGQE